MDSTARRTAGRLAGYLFIAAGAVTLVNITVALPPGADPAVLGAVSGLAAACGVAALVLPWGRWPARATLVVVPLALAIIAVGNATGGDDPYSYAVYFVVLFVWIGVTQPRWTSVALAPLAAVAYVLPFVLRTDAAPTAISSFTVAIPVCVLVGETIAGVVVRLRASEALAAYRAAGMEALAAAETTMEAEVDQHLVGERAVTLAVEILRSAGAAVVVSDAEGDRVIAATGVAPSAVLAATDGDDDGCVLVIPLPGPASSPGRLVVRFDGGCPDDGFTEPAARLFATKVARALEQVQVVEALTNAAVHDALTGIGNRRHAEALLARLVPGDAIVVIDLDHFKHVNDAFGHGFGDEVLAAVGHFLRESVRRADDVARLGGEEFLVVLRQEPNPFIAAQRIVVKWRALGQATTISAGVEVHAPDRSVAETVRRADLALYEAKRSGRDRAVAASVDLDTSEATLVIGAAPGLSPSDDQPGPLT